MSATRLRSCDLITWVSYLSTIDMHAWSLELQQSDACYKLNAQLGYTKCCNINSTPQMKLCHHVRKINAHIFQQDSSKTLLQFWIYCQQACLYSVLVSPGSDVARLFAEHSSNTSKSWAPCEIKQCMHALTSCGCVLSSLPGYRMLSMCRIASTQWV